MLPLHRFEQLSELSKHCGDDLQNAALKRQCLIGMAAELGMDITGTPIPSHSQDSDRFPAAPPRPHTTPGTGSSADMPSADPITGIRPLEWTPQSC